MKSVHSQVTLSWTYPHSHNILGNRDDLSEFSIDFSRHGCSSGFPGGSDDKESACNAGDPVSILGLGRSSGKGNSYPLQYSCLENSMDRGAWWATVHWIQRVEHDWPTNTGHSSEILFHFNSRKKSWHHNPERKTHLF